MSFGGRDAALVLVAMKTRPVVRDRSFTRETKTILDTWLFNHRFAPYASKLEKIELARVTGLTVKQIDDYLANARRRLVWRRWRIRYTRPTKYRL